MTYQCTVIQPLDSASNDFSQCDPNLLFYYHLLPYNPELLHICVKFLITRNTFQCKFIFPQLVLKASLKNPANK